MSKFVTPFAFPLDEIKGQLPKGSFFECVKWNKEKCQVEIYWDHEAYQTGRDHPIEFLPSHLAVGNLPEGVEVPDFLKKLLPALPEGVTEADASAAAVEPKGHEGAHASPDPLSEPGAPAPQSRQVRTGERANVPKEPRKPKGKSN